jgi:hypothetical protein
MNVQEWETKYKPTINKFDSNASWQDDNGNGIMFETYDIELEWLKTQPNENVWTYMDSDDGYLLTAGYHVVNRIGYFITEVPWDNQDIVIEVN